MVGTTQFHYDALGERVKKTSGATTSLYPFGDDYEITNGVVTKYISIEGLGVVAKKVTGGSAPGTYWFLSDRLGSLQGVLDAAGTAVSRRTYRPYGQTLAQSGSHTESRGWIDQRNDTETGLTYLHARYFDPQLGTFLSPDPIGVAGGTNLYGYGLGNPIRGSDRSGLKMVTICHEEAIQVAVPHVDVGQVRVSTQMTCTYADIPEEKEVSPFGTGMNTTGGQEGQNQGQHQGQNQSGGQNSGGRDGDDEHTDDDDPLDPDGDGVIDPQDYHNAIWSDFARTNPDPYLTRLPAYEADDWMTRLWSFVSGASTAADILGTPAFTPATRGAAWTAEAVSRAMLPAGLGLGLTYRVTLADRPVCGQPGHRH